MKIQLLALVSFVIVQAARADEVCFDVHFPIQAVRFNVTAVVPSFDPALGTLTGTRVELSATVLGNPAVESLDNAPLQVQTDFRANVVIKRPDMTAITVAMPTVQFFDLLSAFDGTIDFGGTSGVMHLGATASAAQTTTLSSAPDLMLFGGPPLGSATISLPISVQNVSIVFALGGPVTSLSQSVSVDVRVCHVYVPFGVRYCASNVSSAACPCQNPSPPGAPAGCANATGFGASLSESGLPSILTDLTTLTCSNLPHGSAAMFFQGKTRENSGLGVAFGDGLLCAGGGITRLSVHFAPNGSVSYPGPGDPRLSEAGALSANDVRTYQVWYRDSVSFCMPATFNLSNGVEITWQP